MDGTSGQQAFLASLQRLTAELGGLRQAILNESHFPALLFAHVGPTRETLAEAVTDISYVDGQDPRSTRFAPGLVACSATLARRIQLVNEAKHRFLAARKAYQTEAGGRAMQSLLDAHPMHRDDEVNQVLKRAGSARINLKEADRQIVVLPEQTDRVAYTWFRRGRTIVRISREELMDKLTARAARGQPVLDDINALARLDPDAPLALMRMRSPTLRVNVRMTGEKTYRVRNAVLPIFVIRNSASDPLPEHNEPEPAGMESRRLGRSDQRLTQAPILRTYPVYQYLDNTAGTK